MKKCKKCGIEKPATIEYFIKSNSIRGIEATCRECHNAYNKAYRESHKEHISAYGKAYAKDNKEYIKAYLLDNKEHIAAMAKRYNKIHEQEVSVKRSVYRQANKSEVTGKERAWYKTHKESIASTQKKYAQNNRAKRNTDHNNYMAKRRELPCTLTTEQWGYIKEYLNNRCAYCGEEKPLAQDHFYPLSLGGEFTISNIICACKNCNSSKGPKIFAKWYPRQSFYSKEREQKIFNYLNYKNGVQQLSFI